MDENLNGIRTANVNRVRRQLIENSGTRSTTKYREYRREETKMCSSFRGKTIERPSTDETTTTTKKVNYIIIMLHSQDEVGNNITLSYRVNHIFTYTNKIDAEEHEPNKIRNVRKKNRIHTILQVYIEGDRSVYRIRKKNRSILKKRYSSRDFTKCMEKDESVTEKKRSDCV